MSMCNYLEDAVMEHVFSKTTFTAAATLYVGLCTSVSEAGVITGEHAFADGYARVAVTNNVTNFPNCATPGVMTNGTAIQFPTCVTTRWGTLTTWFISDSATSLTANTYCYGALSVPRVVEIGDAPLFAIGALSMVLD